MSHPERIVPDETSPGIVALHLKRYEFARPRCAGKIVLDAGCGVGYGTAYLAEAAERVVGVDADAEAVRYASERYARPNVSFAVGDLGRLDAGDAEFGAACMFEVIEHLDDPERALAELARTLRPDGVLFVSTPRVPVTTHEPENPYHRVEYAPGDFEALLARFFGGVELFGQRRLQTTRHRLAQRLDVFGLRRRLPLGGLGRRLTGTPPMAGLAADDVVIAPGELDRATEIVAVCSAPHR